MPSRPLVPPLLWPYVNPPSTSLTLLTSTLGCTANWLVLRFLYAALQRSNHLSNSSSSIDQDHAYETTAETRVVLVSWLHDTKFWKDGGRKLGIDLNKLFIIADLDCDQYLGPNSLSKVEEAVVKAINDATEATNGDVRILLVLDGLDFLLAATDSSVLEVLEMIGEFRNVCLYDAS